MALVGALRSGQIDWRCERWTETYTTDRGATYDENGGTTIEEPKYGWPCDFWTPALAADDTAWKANHFISYDTVTLVSAAYKVRIWLQRNNEASAQWMRCADDISLSWPDVVELLGGPGWQVWVTTAHQPKSISPKSHHYLTAMIELLRIAVLAPDAKWDRSSTFERLFNAFDETTGRIPDPAELKRLTARIVGALNSDAEDDAPIE